MEKVTKKMRYERNFAKHIEQLKSIGFTGSFLQLRRLEKKGKKLTMDYSNGVIDSETFQEKDAKLEKEIAKLFAGNELPNGVFTNSDPRGSYIKLSDKFNTFDQENYTYVISCRDWGGNGLLAPGFDDLAD